MRRGGTAEDGAQTGPRATLVSEPVVPAPGTFDPAAMAAGSPGLPTRFRWRDDEYAVAELLSTGRDTGPCRHGSGERYVRRHYFRIRADRIAPAAPPDGPDAPAASIVMTLYFERTGARAKPGSPRWFVYTVEKAAE